MTKQAFTYRATFKIARKDGSIIEDVTTSNTVVCSNSDEVEFIAHNEFFEKTQPVAFPAPLYKILQLPTETNGKLTISKASDYGF